MKLYKRTRKIACLLLAVTIAGVTVFASIPAKTAETPIQEIEADAAPETPTEPLAAGADSTAAKKTETVYVNLDPNGKPYETTVTDWLHSDTPSVEFHDKSDLSDIENIKGDSAPEKTGDGLRWKLDGNDLFYQGRSSKQLPLEVSITYTLDGKPITPEALAGKSGKLEMNLRFQNTSSHTVTISGKETAMFTPLVVAVGLTLPEDTFRNVEVSDGSVVSDGNNQAVAITCLPGLGNSLALGSYSLQEINDLDFPEEYTITADVEEFSLGPIMIGATTKLPNLDDLKKSDDLESLQQDLYDLRDMQNDLNRMDADRDIRSLITDPERTDGARTMVNDIFDFYDLNKDVLDILPKYVTDQNIRLLDRIKYDLKDSTLDTLLDEEDLGDLLDYVDDLSPAKLQELVEDYRLLQEHPDLQRMLAGMLKAYNPTAKALMGQMQQVYGNWEAMDPVVKAQGMQALEQLLQGAAQMNSRAVLQAQAKSTLLGYVNSPDHADVLASVLDGTKLNPQLRAELVSASRDGKLLNPSTMRGVRHESDAEPTSTPVPETTPAPEATPAPSAPPVPEATPAPSAPPVPEATPAPSTPPVPEATPAPSTPPVPEAALPSPTPEGTVNRVSILAEYVSADGQGENAPISSEAASSPLPEATPAPTESIPVPEATPAPIEPSASPEPLPAPVPEKTVKPENPDRQDMYQEITSTATGYYVLEGAIDEYLSKCSDEELAVLSNPGNARGRSAAPVSDPTTALVKMLGALDPQSLMQLLSLSNEYHDTFSGLLAGAEDPQVQAFLRKASADLKLNAENMETLVLLVEKLDETNLLNQVENIDDLRQDLRDARPIVKALKRDLDRTSINKSVHESPETVNVLLQMKEDLERLRDISETMRNMLQPEKIDTSRGMIATLDRLDAKGSADSAIDKLDDLDELLARKDAYVELSQQYGIFTQAPDGVDTDLKFVLRTDEIKKPEPVEIAAAPVEEKQGFSAWLKNLGK